jgi:hypothetical protein
MFRKMKRKTMGIIMSDLNNQSALSVVGAFIISRSSFEYFFADEEDVRNKAIKKLILGAILFETGKMVTFRSTRSNLPTIFCNNIV